MKEFILIFLFMAGLIFSQPVPEDDLLLGAELEEDVPAIEVQVPAAADTIAAKTVEPAVEVSYEAPPVVIAETEEARTERISGQIGNIFDGKNLNMDDIIAGDDPELNGYISNIQAAPFDNNLLSFEVTTQDDESTKLILYNIESQFLIQVSSVQLDEFEIRRTTFPVKDCGANWHPYKNIMVFYSNGYENREQLYMVEITDPHLMDQSGVKVSRIELEEPKGTVNICLYPDFNSNGSDLYFTIKLQKENKKEKYNKDFNIGVIENVLKYSDTEYKGVKYDLVFDRKNSQIKPVCSPTEPDVFAFVSHKKELKDDKGYADYALVVYNRKDKSSSVVDNLTGFRDYPYQWSPSGKRLFYCSALSLSKTPLDLRDKRTNIINLQVANVSFKKEEGITSKVVKNASSEVIMGDVATKDNGIAFFGDEIVMMGKYDPYESIFMVDMKKWHANDGFYAKQLAINLDNDFPVITKEAFLFLRYEYFKTATVSTISRIFYEPKVDEEAEKAKKERREKKKNRKSKAKESEAGQGE
jgi:hypothetical protein